VWGRGGAGVRTVIESLYAACDEKTAKTIEGGGSLDKKGGSVPGRKFLRSSNKARLR
jgi:hypothetical protein